MKWKIVVSGSRYEIWDGDPHEDASRELAIVWDRDIASLIVSLPNLLNNLKWQVNHPGECLGDHPHLLEAATALIAEAEGRT